MTKYRYRYKHSLITSLLNYRSQRQYQLNHADMVSLSYVVFYCVVGYCLLLLLQSAQQLIPLEDE